MWEWAGQEGSLGSKNRLGQIPSKCGKGGGIGWEFVAVPGVDSHIEMGVQEALKYLLVQGSVGFSARAVGPDRGVNEKFDHGRPGEGK